MRNRKPTTQTMKLSDARQQFSPLVNKVFRGEARVIVEKNGIPVAAIISADDLEELSQWEEEKRRDFAIIDELRDAFKDVPDEELELEVTRAIATARKRQRTAVQRAAKAS
jgi:prevent-host-death family protein